MTRIVVLLLGVALLAGSVAVSAPAAGGGASAVAAKKKCKKKQAVPDYGGSYVPPKLSISPTSQYFGSVLSGSSSRPRAAAPGRRR